jgi:hypothetical protein
MITSKEICRDSLETFSYDNDTVMPAYSGFNTVPDQAPLIVDSKSSFQSGTYPFCDSDLFSIGTTLYICNSITKFMKLYSAQPNNRVFTRRTWI